MAKQLHVRDLARVRDITTTLVRHGFGHLVRQAGLEAQGQAETAERPVAARIRMALADLGPTFVKLGQVLSVRPDIVPAPVMLELQKLQTDVPPAPFDAIREVVETELGGPLNINFLEFGETPIASASIAQVHKAVLKDGREVAVKVQRPGIEATIRSDVQILYALARLATGRIDIPGLYTPVGIVQEFEDAIGKELDFLQEARAAQRFRENFKENPNVVAPRIHTRWNTRRVLTMELLPGKRLADVTDEDLDGGQFMRKFIEAIFEQVFEHGFFHGDPHPGNLLLMPDDRIAFLDFGLTGRLTGEMQDTLMNCFVGAVYEDAESVALSIYRAGATEERIDLKAFKADIERLMTKYHGASIDQLKERATMAEFIQTAARYRIRLPQEYAVLARMGSIVDGMAHQLMPDADVVAEIRPLAQRLISQRFAPERVGADALRLIQLAQIAARDVPTQMGQLMVDLQRGNLAITTRDPESQLLREEIRFAGLRVSLALATAALAITGALLVQPWSPTFWGIPLNALIGTFMGLVGLGMFALLVLHMMMASALRPREIAARVAAVFRFLFGRRD